MLEHFKSLSAKLLVPVLLLLVLAVGGLTLAVLLGQRASMSELQRSITDQAMAAIDEQGQTELNSAEKALQAKVEGLSRLVADAAGVAMANYDTPAMQNLAEQMCGDEDILGCQFLDAKGAVVAQHAATGKVATGSPRFVTLTVRHDGSAIGRMEVKYLADRLADRKAQIATRTREVRQEVKTRAGALSATGLRHSLSTGVLAGLLAIAVAFALLLPLIRSLLRPLREGVALAEAVGRGDLGHRLTIRSQDEVGRLAEALNHMAESLSAKARLADIIAEGDLTQTICLASKQDVLGQALSRMNHNLAEVLGTLGSATCRVSSGSEQILSAAQSLSQGATEQASSLQEISSSMSQIDSQTRRNAENATQASALAAAARQSAAKGAGEVDAMSTAMGEMQAASLQITKVVKLIDAIAFQTNLLALNAAVEAARAGSHGKGFAVVAEEVRSLAGRSATAARETADLLEGTVRKIENGTTIAKRMESSLSELTQNAGRVADLVGEIAAASKEQACGVTRVTQGLRQIDQVTQQNTAAAEQTSSAAQELASHAAELQQLMGRFRLRGDEGADPTGSARG